MNRLLNFVSEHRRLFIIILVLGALIIAGRIFEIHRYIDGAFIREVLTLNWYVSLPIFVSLCCLANLTNSPATIIMTSVVFVMGRNAAIPLIFIGSVSACIFTFFMVSLIAKNSLPEIKNPRVHKWMARLETQPILAIFVLRFLVQFLPALNYALGMSKVRFKDYFIGTFLGMIIPSIFLSFFYEFLLKAGKLMN